MSEIANETTPLNIVDRDTNSTVQFKTYLFIAIQAVLNLLLASLLWLIWSEEYNIFLWHPTFAILFFYFIIQGVSSLKFLNSSKEFRFKLHMLFQLLAATSLLLAVTIIYKETEAGGFDHFESLHGKIGVSVLVLVPLISVFAAAIKFFPQLFPSNLVARKLLKPHRLFGYVAFGLVSLNVVLGLESAYQLSSTYLAYWVYPAGLFLVGAVFSLTDIKKVF